MHLCVCVCVVLSRRRFRGEEEGRLSYEVVLHLQGLRQQREKVRRTLMRSRLKIGGFSFTSFIENPEILLFSSCSPVRSQGSPPPLPPPRPSPPRSPPSPPPPSPPTACGTSVESCWWQRCRRTVRRSISQLIFLCLNYLMLNVPKSFSGNQYI